MPLFCVAVESMLGEMECGGVAYTRLLLEVDGERDGEYRLL